ncbi:hypothetical protein [Paenibacillus xylanexedens]|uniref:DUF7167 family protein n=1 Tax=Paenibacillus xylanexedens TaxID=528191 RepID=UPI0011A28322|nr:hypothetical protein [Paenibacillus xylanexedens]
MAQYEFWARLDKKNEVIDIPDEEFEGKTEKEIEDMLLDKHIVWARKQIYGGWYSLILPGEEEA